MKLINKTQKKKSNKDNTPLMRSWFEIVGESESHFAHRHSSYEKKAKIKGVQRGIKKKRERSTKEKKKGVTVRRITFCISDFEFVQRTPRGSKTRL